MLDEYCYGVVTKISPENHNPIFGQKANKFYLGGAGNVALNLSRMGNKVYLLGKLNKDTLGLKILKLCKENKINFIPFETKEQTILKKRYITDYGHLLRVDFESVLETTRKNEKKIKKKIFDISRKIKFDGIYVADYNKGFINKIIINALLKNKSIFFADPKNPDISMFKNFDFIKPNKIYTESLLKQKINTTSKSRLFKSIKILLKKFKLKNLIVTLGADGVAFINSTKKIYEASKKIQFYNLSGAGDVFGAAFFTAYLKNKDIKEALKFANYSTSLAIQKKGTASINEYELDNNEPIYYFKKDKLKLRKILENKKNEKIAFTNGCFDIFHPGHLSLIKFAKKKSNYLIIGLNSDKSVKKLKGKNRPIISEQERAMLLANLKDVNLVIIFDEISPLSLIKFIEPNFLIKGGDYKNKKIIGNEYVKKIGGKTYLAPLIDSFSSSKIINKNE